MSYAFAKPITLSDQISDGAIYGLVVAVVICAVWYYWAMNTYRTSVERVSALCLAKYQLDPANANKLGESGIFEVTNVVLNPTKTSVEMDINVKDKLTKQILSSEHKVFVISDTCGVIDVSCISV